MYGMGDGGFIIKEPNKAPQHPQNFTDPPHSIAYLYYDTSRPPLIAYKLFQCPLFKLKKIQAPHFITDPLPPINNEQSLKDFLKKDGNEVLTG